MHADRLGGWKPPVTRQVALGEEGFFLLRYTGPQLTAPLQGDYTGHWYNYHQRKMLLVDKRDAVYLLGPEFDVM